MLLCLCNRGDDTMKDQRVRCLIARRLTAREPSTERSGFLQSHWKNSGLKKMSLSGQFNLVAIAQIFPPVIDKRASGYCDVRPYGVVRRTN